MIECPETPELERSCPPPNDQSVFLTERSSGLPLDSILEDIVSTGGQVSMLSGDGREEACLHVDLGGVSNVYECLVNSGGYAFAVCQVNLGDFNERKEICLRVSRALRLRSERLLFGETGLL